jgi:dsDNA-specific endonuclease/ATPase MutS2
VRTLKKNGGFMTENEDKKSEVNVDDVVAKLKTWRDELKLQAHLFKAETKDEWNDLEKKMDHLLDSAKKMESEATVAVTQFATDAKQNVAKLSQQMMERYAKFKESFKDEPK